MRKLPPAHNYLDKTFDHRLLNDQVDFRPTGELLAGHLAEWFQGNIESVMPITLVAMEVAETATTSAGDGLYPLLPCPGDLRTAKNVSANFSSCPIGSTLGLCI